MRHEWKRVGDTYRSSWLFFSAFQFRWFAHLWKCTVTNNTLIFVHLEIINIFLNTKITSTIVQILTILFILILVGFVCFHRSQNMHWYQTHRCVQYLYQNACHSVFFSFYHYCFWFWFFVSCCCWSKLECYSFLKPLKIRINLIYIKLYSGTHWERACTNSATSVNVNDTHLAHQNFRLQHIFKTNKMVKLEQKHCSSNFEYTALILCAVAAQCCCVCAFYFQCDF